MKTLKNNLSAVIVALFELMVGIILLVKPVGLTSLIVMALGFVLVLGGAGAVIKYFRTDPEEAAKEQNLVKGLCMLAAGGFCLFNSGWFIDTFAVLATLYGVILVITGLGKVQWTVDTLRQKKQKWYLAAIGAALTLICGVIVLCNPFKTAKVLWVFLGITLIVEAVVDTITLIFRLRVATETEAEAGKEAEMEVKTEVVEASPCPEAENAE